MTIRRILFVPLLFAMVASLLGTVPVLARSQAAAITGIDDPSGDPHAPGVNVIRKVDAKGTVIVRLNRGDRQAHFDIFVRGADVVGIGDRFRRANGLESGKEDGIWGGCQDELVRTFGPTITRQTDGDLVAQAKFYTCKQHDSIRIHLDNFDIYGTAAIKIVFTDAVLGNVDGVFVGADPVSVGEDWIPLWSDS